MEQAVDFNFLVHGSKPSSVIIFQVLFGVTFALGMKPNFIKLKGMKELRWWLGKNWDQFAMCL